MAERVDKGGNACIHDEENVRRGIQENAVKPSYASNKSVGEEAKDLWVLLYGWRAKYTPEVDKTRYATLEETCKVLRLKNAEQAMEIDMLGNR